MPENNLPNHMIVANRKRGRPRKVLSPEEILALQNQVKRPRGRPKKEWTPEELALRAAPKRPRGRPPKNFSPQEEWVLTYAPKKEMRGRPHKNFVLAVALPRVNFQQAQAIACEVKEQQPAAQIVLEKISQVAGEIKNGKEIKKEVKKIPTMAWQQFKELIKLPDLAAELPENYLFPSEEISQQNKSKIKVSKKDKLSAHVVDLRFGNFHQEVVDKNFVAAPFVPAQEVKYLWELEKDKTVSASQSAATKFELPVEAAANSYETNLIKQRQKKDKKKKNLRVDLRPAGEKVLVMPAPMVARHWTFYLFDWPLIQLGKFLYFTWQIITAPFRLLDFLVDRTLKGLWFLLLFLPKIFYKLFKNNLVYLRQAPMALASLFSHRRLVVPVAVTRARFSLRPLFSFLVLVLVLVAPFLVWRTWEKSRQVRGDVLGVSSQAVAYLQQAANNFQNNDLTGAVQNLGRAHNSFAQAQQQIANLGPVFSTLKNLVPEAKEGKKLIQAGELISASATELAKALNLFSVNDEKFTLTDKISFLQEVFNKEEQKIGAAVILLDSVAAEDLPAQVGAQLSLVKNNLANWQQTAQRLKDFLIFSNQLLGSEGHKRYLVVFQNSRELRPTGGFLGSFALVDVERGKIKKLDIPGGGLYDLKSSNLTAVAAPKPLQIFSPSWQIWNANWFPDWPTSAQKIIWFYENNYGGSSVDGVISLTYEVVADLLATTGPVEMKEYDKNLTAENFTTELQMAVELEYDKNENRPKAIIGDLAPILLTRLLNLNAGSAWPVILNLNQALSEKKLLFYFTDPALQTRVAQFGWGGQIKAAAANQDYLMVVHTNISGGKTDSVIKNTVKHQVEVLADGSLQATVTLTREHQGDPTKLFEADNNVDYARFYVPRGAQLISASGFNFVPDYFFKYGQAAQALATDQTLAAVETNVALDEKTNTRISEEFDKTVFGNWLQVAPGQTRTAIIKYLLPFKFGQTTNENKLKLWLATLLGRPPEEKYSLLVAKQPGMNAVDFSSEFILPADYQVAAVAGAAQAENNKVKYNFDLLTDGYYGLVLEK